MALEVDIRLVRAARSATRTPATRPSAFVKPVTDAGY